MDPNCVLNSQTKQFIDNWLLAAYGTLPTDQFEVICVFSFIELNFYKVFVGLRVPVLKLGLLSLAFENHNEDKRGHYESKDCHQGNKHPG